jgi:hypothetical protein
MCSMAQATLGIISSFFFEIFCHFFTQKKKTFFWIYLFISIVHSTNFANFLEIFAKFLYQKIEGKTPWL